MLLIQLRRFAAIAGAVAMALACSNWAGAAPLSIFNTGVDPSGNALLGNGTPDPHYSILVNPGTGSAVTVDPTNYPFPFWLPNNANSRWIGPFANSQDVTGNYVYRTTFNVPVSAVLSSVSVTGDWATDDPGTDIYINGIPTGQTSFGYASLAPFSVNSGFVFGTNTLDFYLTNGSSGVNPTGLRVDHIVGTYQIVPEPSMIVLVTGGLAMCVGFSSRKSRGGPNA